MMKYAITLALFFALAGNVSGAPQRLTNGSSSSSDNNRYSHLGRYNHSGSTRPVKIGPGAYSKYDPANPYRDELDYKGQNGFERWLDERFDNELTRPNPDTYAAPAESFVPKRPSHSGTGKSGTGKSGAGTTSRANSSIDRATNAVKPATVEPSGAPVQSRPMNNRNVERPNGDRGPAIITNPFL